MAMVLSARDDSVVQVDPSTVPQWVETINIGMYGYIVVATILIYDTCKLLPLIPPRLLFDPIPYQYARWTGR